MDKLTVINKNFECDFCGCRRNDPLKYGLMYKLGDIIAHYFCVLLSSTLVQNGKDDEGMLGFLYPDIKKLLKKCSNVLCFYCKSGDATLKCCVRSCRKIFHYPCGLKNGCLSQFMGSYKSFCHLHCPVQNIPKDILKEAYKIKLTCCICYEKLHVKNKRDILWAPCCLKTWYHTHCVQKLACSAGYFFRCPACNDVEKFSKCVQEFGIFIPQQDASWELVPNAYEELLFRYNKCDAEVCLCPLGRQGEADNPAWEIILCGSCGSQGIHVACGRLEHTNSEWECPECQEVTKSITFTSKSSGYKSAEGSSGMLKISGICQKKRRRGSEDLENLVLDKRKKCRQEVQEEEEIEIDVETVDGETKDTKIKTVVDELIGARKDRNEGVVDVKSIDPQEVLTLVKPGPLSYKLGIIRKALKNSQTPSVTSVDKKSAKPATVIVLTDSEEEAEADDDVKVIGVGKEVPLCSPSNSNSEIVDSSSSETEKSYNLVIFSSEFPKPEEKSFSFSDFDILAVMSFHSSGDRKKDDDRVKALNKFTEQGPDRRVCERYLSVYPVTENKSLPWRVEEGTCIGTQELKLIETGTNKRKN